MKECIAFTQKNGEFTIEFENGKIKRGAPEQSYALHNLLCFGRLDKNLTINPIKRRGWSGSSAYVREFFSSAWNYYLESEFTKAKVDMIINEFNKACTRDYSLGLVDKKIKISQIIKLDRTTMKISLTLDSSPSEIIIKL